MHTLNIINGINSFMANLTGLFIMLRLLLIVLFFIAWPISIQYCAKSYQWPADKTQFWLAQRFRMTAWLIIIDIFVCEHLLALFF